MRRYHSGQSVRVRRRRRRIVQRAMGEYAKTGYNWDKMHPRDCGVTRCERCHMSKVLSLPTRASWRADQSFREWMEIAAIESFDPDAHRGGRGVTRPLPNVPRVRDSTLCASSRAHEQTNTTTRRPNLTGQSR